MRDAFSCRLSPETSWDENMKGRPILSLILAVALRPSVGVLAPNEAKTHRPGFVKLTAGGLSDSVMLSEAQTHDKTFDVSPASALHNLFVFGPFGVTGNSSPTSREEEWEYWRERRKP